MTVGRLAATNAAARMTWVQLDGPTVDSEAVAFLEDEIGGIVLFARNIASPEQVRRLTRELRGRARAPLRIAVDQEGGHIVRLGGPVTRFPSAMAIGATGSATLARRVARATGLQLAALGIDVDLGPVLDLAADLRNPAVGVRSFGASPDLVARLATGAVLGFLDAGVIPTPKHFPGHGRTPLDTHVASAIVEGGLDALRQQDLVPFRSAIAAGSPAVMVSQVIYEGLGEGLPATLSRAVLDDLLRGELAFEGMALTDAMVMDGVAGGRSVADVCVQALIAGADAVMPLGHQREVLASIAEAIEDGRLSQQRIARSLGRIEGLSGVARAPQGNQEALDFPRAGDERLARDVARASLTLVRGSLEWAIDPATSVALVEVGSSRPSPIEDERAAMSLLAPVLGERLPRLASVHIRPTHADLALAGKRGVELAAAAELVILATRDSFLVPEAVELSRRLVATGKPVLHVALRNPYDLVALAPAAVAIAAYSDVPATLRALVDALTIPGPAAARFPGRLPVALPAVEPRTALDGQANGGVRATGKEGSPAHPPSVPYVADLSA